MNLNKIRVQRSKKHWFWKSLILTNDG